ncbi:preprotein translocase subunit SecE [Candidatus Parcubacteria bacterium]|nr:preprotein translocase subunit SecE [Candidatus Parcubacteria bacterium]
MTTTQKIQSFFKEVYVELRKTNWLSRREVIRYTLMVFLVTVVVAAFLGGLDYIFSTAIKSFVF